MAYQGGCHCGAIAFDVDAAIEGVIECNCSLCSKRGYLLWFVPRERVSFRSGDATPAVYRFNTMHIGHEFCATCGCAPYAAANAPDGTPMVAVNVRCLDGVDVHALDIKAVDGRSR